MPSIQRKNCKSSGSLIKVVNKPIGRLCIAGKTELLEIDNIQASEATDFIISVYFFQVLWQFNKIQIQKLYLTFKSNPIPSPF